MSNSTLDAPSQTPHGVVKTELTGMPSRYRQDHRNPVNHFLHVGVGWPMAAIAVILLLIYSPTGILGIFDYYLTERRTKVASAMRAVAKSKLETAP